MPSIALLTLVLVLISDSAQQAPPDLAQLSWITGSWVMEKDGTRVEEHWTPPPAGTMLATGRTLRGDKTVFFEFLRIAATPEGIVYFASPAGRHPPTPFKMIEITDDKVVFENSKHDFPTKITYWKEKDGGLGAKIEGKRGGHEASESWVFKKAADQ